MFRQRLELRRHTPFEARGTGTPTGDPTEAGAIYSVFCKSRSPQEPTIVGAIKPNIGHLGDVSGLPSIIKTGMVLENGVILRNTCVGKLPPKILVDEWNIKVLTLTALYSNIDLCILSSLWKTRHGLPMAFEEHPSNLSATVELMLMSFLMMHTVT